MSFVFRQPPSGSVIVGDNDNDTILWDVATQTWKVGPGGGGGGAVSSVFGRTGAVTAQSGDYDSDQVDNLSSVPGSAVSDALDYLLANAGAVGSVFGRTGTVTAQSGDYAASEVTNNSSVAGVGVSGALNTLAGAITGLVTGVSSVYGRAGAVVAGSGDYTAAQITNGGTAPGANVEAALNALNFIKPVDVATTGNITLSGEQTIDGVLTSSSDVLVWQQTTASQNGVYTSGAGAWARRSDMAAASGFRPGVFFVVRGGTANGNKVACLLTPQPVVVGTTSIAFGLSMQAPSTPADDGKIAVAQAGQLVYTATTNITPNFGANALTAGAATLSGALQTTSYISAGGTSGLPTAGTWRTAHATSLKARNAANTGNVNLWDWGATTPDNLLVGDSAYSMTLDSASAITLKSGGVTRMTVGTNLSSYVTRFRFKPGIGDCTIEIEAGTGGPAQLLNIIGQNLTTAATTGGSVAILPGQGGAGGTGGELYLANAAAVKHLRINDTGMAFFGAAPIAKPTVTGSRGGNAALASVLTQLAAFNLITDGSSA